MFEALFTAFLILTIFTDLILLSGLAVIVLSVILSDRIARTMSWKTRTRLANALAFSLLLLVMSFVFVFDLVGMVIIGSGLWLFVMVVSAVGYYRLWRFHAQEEKSSSGEGNL